MLELFQGQRGLAAAGTAYQDQGRWPTVDRVLGIVKRQWLVEQVDRGVFRVQVAQRLSLTRRCVGLDVDDPLFVDLHATQKA